jgi:sugar phosphate isomerase/epimerase
MNLQIGIRLHDTKDLYLEERLEEVSKQGFCCGHLAISKVLEPYYAKNAALTPGFAQYLKAIFEKNKISIAVLGCYLNVATPDLEAYKKIQKTYEAHIRFASQLGCGVVGTETGAPNLAYKFEEACHSEEALNLFIERFRPIVEYAEKMGVLIAIEPVYKHIVYSAKQARKVLDQIQSPNLRIILDPVNLLDISNYEKQDEIIREAIELLHEEIDVVHIKDFIVENNQLKAVAAGEGLMDYKRLLGYLKQNKPYIQATLENTNPQNAETAREYIETLWQQV